MIGLVCWYEDVLLNIRSDVNGDGQFDERMERVVVIRTGDGACKSNCGTGSRCE